MALGILTDHAFRYGLPAISLGLISFIVGYLARTYMERKLKGKAEDEADRIVEEAKREAENIKKEAVWEGKEQVEKKREEVEKELGRERELLEERELELQEKEEELEERLEQAYSEIDELKEKRKELEKKEKQVEEKFQEAQEELEKVSGLTATEARKKLRESLEEEARENSAPYIKKVENEARDKAEKHARRIVARALQRSAVEQTTEATVTVVDLPSDDMKGRIIGRNGRNIRTFEDITGVDLIVDDTPEAVSISCFNPIRRAIAANTLEKLILDGRIQPARIEEVYDKTRDELEESIWDAGEEALSEVGVPGVADELTRRLGRLNYITEAGQNQLDYSIQVANIAGIIAAEMGADVEMAKRCGILHAIGKTVRDNPDLSYALAGAELVEKHGEPESVIYALAAHNEEKPFKTVEGIILHVASRISRQKPGARKEKFGSFINRLEKLEELAGSFDGVEKTFAIQAGREVRIIVEDELVEDDQAELLARDIANRIQEEIDYPDQIKVSLVREKRVIDFAR